MDALLAIRLASEARDGDIADAMTVMTAAFPPEYGEAWSAGQLASMMRLPGAALAVARLGEKPVGFALMRTIAGESELLLLAVHPDHRGAGHGSRLLDRCMSEAERNGARTMFLEVRADNPAIRLYSRAGFLQYNIRRNYYSGKSGQRYDALSFKIIMAQD